MRRGGAGGGGGDARPSGGDGNQSNREGSHREYRGGGRGSGSGGGRGRDHYHHYNRHPNRSETSTRPPSRPTRSSILDLSQYISKPLLVKFSGGLSVTGTLAGYDALLNLVLDDSKNNETGETYGRSVVRGTGISALCPVEGMEELEENPFLEDA